MDPQNALPETPFERAMIGMPIAFDMLLTILADHYEKLLREERSSGVPSALLDQIEMTLETLVKHMTEEETDRFSPGLNRLNSLIVDRLFAEEGQAITENFAGDV